LPPENVLICLSHDDASNCTFPYRSVGLFVPFVSNLCLMIFIDTRKENIQL